MTPMRFAVAAAAAFFCFGVAPSHAQYYGDAPWCAQIELGTGGEQWDCYYRSVEECVPNVLAGNRGSCSVNPYYRGQPDYAGHHGPVARPPHRKHHRH